MGRLNRAFEAWCVAERVPIEAIAPRGRQRLWRYSLPGYPDGLEIVLDHGHLSVVVHVDGVCWDLLFDRNVSVFQVGKGYGCRICHNLPDGLIFETVEAVWIDHLFQPFTEWHQNQALTARFLCLFGEIGSMTWAYLNDEVPEGCVRVVPLVPVANGDG